MTAWKLRWIWFRRNWMFVGAAYAMDSGVYPSKAGLVYTTEWLELYRARRAAGRDPEIVGVLF